MVIIKYNLISGALFFMFLFNFFHMANEYECKANRRMESEFKSKTILLKSYLRELEETHSYKKIEIIKDREKKIEDENDFVNVRSKEIIKHINGEALNRRSLYKIAVKEFESYVNRFFYQ